MRAWWSVIGSPWPGSTKRFQYRTRERPVGRPEFDQPSKDEGGSGRREKKQRSRTLRPLMEARDRALQDSEQRG